MNSIFLHHLINYSAVICGVVGAVTDLRSRRIPNWLTFPVMLLGTVLHVMVGGWREGTRSLLGLLLCGTVFLVCYIAGGMGAGDVKLVAAEGSLLGLSGSSSFLLYTVLCGGVMGLVLALKRGKACDTLTNVVRITLHHSRNGLKPHPDLNLLNERTLRLPYAVAISFGCLLTILSQPAMSAQS